MLYDIYSPDGSWIKGSVEADTHEAALLGQAKAYAKRTAGRRSSLRLYEDGMRYIVVAQSQPGHNKAKLLRLAVSRQPVFSVERATC